MVDFARDHAWLIPALPLLAAVLIGITGAKILKGLSHLPAILAMLGSFALAMGLLWGFQSGQISESGTGAASRDLFTWFSAGSVTVPVGMHIDHLTAVYLAFVTGIGTLIFIYASGYMKGDYGYFRFFAYMSLFVFFMTVLVMGNNFILLYLGWEGVGLSSYLLIGYYYPRPSAVAAAKKAFITNRIGDFGFAIGIFAIYLAFGTFQYYGTGGVLEQAVGLHEHGGSGVTTLMMWIPFLLMVGAFGKSAQFPLHVWLPDAMEGPTPVSALIHAATMVTAGIYMIARCMPLFVLNPAALDTVAVIGCFTAFMAASIAMCTYDLKRVWAYSTLSQLGYMFLGLGVLASSSAVFHVFTHAWFKALLFLSAGSVMHAMGGELDLRKMSGIRKYMPKTMVLMGIGCMALAGVPGFAGFFSKDQIIAAAINRPGGLGWLLGLAAMLTALMTAYYTFRLFFRVFWGPVVLPATAGGHEASPFAIEETSPRSHEAPPSKTHEEELGRGNAGDGDHGLKAELTNGGYEPTGASAPHGGHDAHNGDEHGHLPNDGPVSMWGPLVILALGAAFAGFVGAGHGGGWIGGFLGGMPGFGGGEAAGGGAEAEAAAHVSEGVLFVISCALPLLGILGAWYFHLRNRHAADIVAANVRPLQRFLENKWYFDELYKAVLIKPLWVVGQGLYLIDRFVVDGVVALVAWTPQVMGYSLKPTQRGQLQRYAVGMVAGVAAIVGAVMYLLR